MGWNRTDWILFSPYLAKYAPWDFPHSTLSYSRDVVDGLHAAAEARQRRKRRTERQLTERFPLSVTRILPPATGFRLRASRCVPLPAARCRYPLGAFGVYAQLNDGEDLNAPDNRSACPTSRNFGFGKPRKRSQLIQIV